MTTGPSTKRVLATWANALADWEEGKQCSPSSDDMVADYEQIIGKLAVDPREAFYAESCNGATLEQLLNFLEECEHVQPHQPTAYYQVIEVPLVRGPAWTVLKWDENERCVGGDHHWLIEQTAHKARELYQQGTVLHGATESEVLKHI